jgi:hypothetical protein
MQRWIALLCLALASVCAISARAQSAAGVQRGVSYCTATDTGSAQGKIWASPVFAFDYPRADLGALARLNAIAAEFLQHVYTLGGAGEKNCTLYPSQSEAEASREQERARWSKRMYFVKLGDWREVAWTPAPWDPSTVATTPAPMIKYFRCYVTQTNIPDRSDRGRTVVSNVFAMAVPGKDPMASYTQARAYAEEFKQVVRAQGVSDEGVSCIAHDSQAEADKALVDYRRLFKGFNMKYVEVAWTPSAQAAVSPTPVRPPAAAESPAAMPASSTAHAPIENTAVPVNAVEVDTTKAPAGGRYCTAFVTHVKPPLMARTPVWQVSAAQGNHEALAASLVALTRAVIQASAVKWKEFPPVQCFHDVAGHAGETYCSSNLFRTFGSSQLSGMFCNSSRAMIDKRSQEMTVADGGHSQLFQWPAKP